MNLLPKLALMAMVLGNRVKSVMFGMARYYAPLYPSSFLNAV